MSIEILDGDVGSGKPKRDLNTANSVLTMGIVSLVLSLVLGGILGIGTLVLGIMAIVKGRQAMSLYKDYPNDYTSSSLNKVKAGFICGIIGVVIWGVVRILYLLLLAA